MKKRPDGRYQAQITIGKNISNGKPIKKTLYGKTKAELQALLGETRAKLSKGLPVIESKKSFGEFADFWLKNKKGIQPSTLKGYRIAISTHIKPYFSHFLLKDIKQYHIEDFINDLATKNDLATTTISKIKITLLQILKEAVKREYIFINLSGVKTPKTKQNIRQPLNCFEQNLINEHFRAHRCGIFALTLLYTGMRLGEAIALKWDCVDFSQNIIHIKYSASLLNNQPHNQSTKTLNSIRTIPLVEPLKSALQNHIEKSNNIYCFTSVNNKQLTETAYRRMWDSYMLFLNNSLNEDESIKICIKFTPHQLRHTYATILFEKNINVKTAQMWLGHADIRTTLNIYTHLTNEQSESEANKLIFSSQSKVCQTEIKQS